MINSPLRTSQSSFVLAFFSAMAGLLLPGAAAAGSFSVSPVRIYMQARERATAITVVNEGDAELVMQAELFSWSQTPEGVDKLEPTDDLVLAPPITKIAPRSRQVLRLASLRPPPSGAQQTYRMIVREVPEARPKQDQVEVQVALAFSLPVFITPPGARSALNCTAARSTPTSVRVTCRNSGQAYAQPIKMTLEDEAGRALATRDISGGYVLPQVARTFELTSGSVPLPPGAAKLLVTQDDGSKHTFDVRLAD